MVDKKTASRQAKRLKVLQFVPSEGREEIGEILKSAQNEGHCERAVQRILDTEDRYPTPRIMRAALEAEPATLGLGCPDCDGLGMFYVDNPYPGGMKFCSCAAGKAKVEVIGQ